jgi:2'-5' RNA ligase
MSETWRLFIAVDLPDHVLDSLRRTQNKLQKVTPERAVRWVHVEGIHLTLKFLGDTPIHQVDDLTVALGEAVSPHRCFELRTQGLGCFPNTNRPRVVWVGIKGEVQPLALLQADVEQGMQALGFEAENQQFYPHLTLGRMQRNASRQDAIRVGEAVEADQSKSPSVSWQVDSVSLIRSQLQPGGAVYTQVNSFRLKS